MNNFVLDAKLSEDCIQLGESELNLLLLMNNALVPWLVLVPKIEARIVEIYQLPDEQQQTLFQEMNLVAKFLQEHFDTDKVNTGAIGNIVRQMHIHVVGRKKGDFCWPNVVWGAQNKEIYSKESLEGMGEKVKEHLPFIKTWFI